MRSCYFLGSALVNIVYFEILLRLVRIPEAQRTKLAMHTGRSACERNGTKFYAPLQRYATRREISVQMGLQVTDGTLTLHGALFQVTYTCAQPGKITQDYNSRARLPIFILSSSLFTRRYWGNPI